MSVINFLLKQWRLILAGLALMGLVVFASRACRLSDKAERLAVQYETYRALAMQEREAANKYISQLLSQIKGKDREIADLNKSVSDKNAAIVKGGKKLADLEKDYAAITDCPAKVANLEQQVAGWKAQFNLSQSVVAEQQKIISAWEVKFANQVAITEQVQAMLDKADALNRLGEQRIAVLERDAKKFRFGSRVKTILIAGAVGYIGYTLLPKGK